MSYADKIPSIIEENLARLETEAERLYTLATGINDIIIPTAEVWSTEAKIVLFSIAVILSCLALYFKFREDPAITARRYEKGKDKIEDFKRIQAENLRRPPEPPQPPQPLSPAASNERLDTLCEYAFVNRP